MRIADESILTGYARFGGRFKRLYTLRNKEGALRSNKCACLLINGNRWDTLIGCVFTVASFFIHWERRICAEADEPMRQNGKWQQLR
jgi:hypothetical protein